MLGRSKLITKTTPTSHPFPHLRHGVDGFLSSHAVELLIDSYGRHLAAVAELAFGCKTPTAVLQAQSQVFRIIEAAERDEGKLITNSRLLHHASQAWNLEFFFRGLTCGTPTVPSQTVIEALSHNFGSLDNFKRSFESHAGAMIGCGWIWLIKDVDEGGSSSSSGEPKLKILTTFNGASPLFKSHHHHHPHHLHNPRQQTFHFQSKQTPTKSFSHVRNPPILALNLWESAFILDYGLDREEYVKNWWDAINWNSASVLLTK